MSGRLSQNPAGTFIAGGHSPTIADFSVASFVFTWIENPNTKMTANLQWAQAEIAKNPLLKKYIDKMRNELKDHLAKRPASSF